MPSYVPMYVAVNLHVDDTIIIQECNFLPQQVYTSTSHSTDPIAGLLQ